MSTDINLDDILQKLGPFGRYNIVNYALLLFPIYLAGMYGSVFVFEAPDISYRCHISECENLNHTDWLEYAIPKEKGEISKCKRFQFRDNISRDVCNKNEFETTMAVECTEFVYSDEDSAVKDFDLGCDWRRTLIGSIHNAGLFIALPLTGFISDKYGRKIALSVATLMNGVFGVLRSFSTSYIMMLIFEFLETALGGGVNSTAFVFAMELVHPKGRVFGNLILNSVAVVGAGTLALLAWQLQNWRVLIRVIYAPALLGIAYLWVMNESPRWLISKGRKDEAMEILKKAAKMNKVNISDETLSPLNAVGKSEENEEATPTPALEKNEKGAYILVKALKSNIIRNRLIICSVLWVTCTFVYYGLAINSVSLAGNQYLNFALVAFVEIPSTFIGLLVLDKFGRKRVLIATYLLSGCLCIGLSFVPKDLKIVSLLIYLLGKCTITIAYFSVYIYVSEVFPTSVRQSLLAVCSSFGRFGSTLAPLTPLLPMRSVIFGCLAFVATLLVLLLPETKNMSLPNTIEEAERISQKTRRKSTENTVE
ncbi:organic cation transporter protein-like isoform X2 [Aricia agestis]|uniref:organic cation transporter protein-like isoform X2 n=1 Tax=Aricia agestis TaxID=91739 RepID=UPI001C208BFD|nr:organic cation transporter protein-like isoform X2 [Aricia agestis]